MHWLTDACLFIISRGPTLTQLLLWFRLNLRGGKAGTGRGRKKLSNFSCERTKRPHAHWFFLDHRVPENKQRYGGPRTDIVIDDERHQCGERITCRGDPQHLSSLGRYLCTRNARPRRWWRHPWRVSLPIASPWWDQTASPSWRVAPTRAASICSLPASCRGVLREKSFVNLKSYLPRYN